MGEILIWQLWPPLAIPMKNGPNSGATLYRNLVQFGAIQCEVERACKSFIISSLWLPMRQLASGAPPGGKRTTAPASGRA